MCSDDVVFDFVVVDFDFDFVVFDFVDVDSFDVVSGLGDGVAFAGDGFADGDLCSDGDDSGDDDAGALLGVGDALIGGVGFADGVAGADVTGAGGESMVPVSSGDPLDGPSYVHGAEV